MADPNAITTIEQYLQHRQRHFTLTEAAALTGLSIDAAREALSALLPKYVCRLQVSEHGDLVYNFGETLRRRNAKTFAEYARDVGAWLWKVFTIIYKAWIAVTLVVYFVIFLVLIIVMILAASAGSKSDDRSDRRRASAFDLAILLRMFFSIFQWQTVTDTFDYERDRKGYRYRSYRPVPAALNTTKKNFIAAVYDFVFGPSRPASEPLQNEKEVAMYLRQHKGLVTASELSALAGWTFAQAETFMTDCILRYQGETKISDNAVLYGEFDSILRRVDETQHGKVTYYWDEYEPPYQLTGNSSGYNALIALMNGFNWLFALLVINGSLTRLLQGTEMRQFAPELAHVTSGPLFAVLLGWVPLIFSTLFVLIPIGRWLRLQRFQRQRENNNIRKRLFKAIFATQGRPQALPRLLAAVNTNAEEETLSERLVNERMQALALDMEGDMQVNDAAEVVYAFPRITRELQEVEQLRQQRRVDRTLGEVIIESDNIVESDN